MDLPQRNIGFFHKVQDIVQTKKSANKMLAPFKAHISLIFNDLNNIFQLYQD